MKYNERFKLTAMPATNRWRKIHRGKTYYVGCGHCASKHDREGYKVAIAEWRELLDRLENTPTPDDVALYEDAQQAKRLLEELANRAGPLKTVTAHGRRYAIMPRADWMIETDGKRFTADEYDRAVAEATKKVEGGASKKDTIEAAVESFLATKKERHSVGNLSASRVRLCRLHLRTVEDVLGKDTSVADITEEAVKTYWQSLVDHLKAEDYGRTTAADRWATFKEWVRSIYAIPQPRNLNSRDLSISKPAKKVVVWSVEEVKDRFRKASERLRLFLLLQLNCGMYGGDISNLRPSEVDWTKGRITRKRSKTERLDSTPVVDYPLWAATFELLRKYGNRTGERVFSYQGGALVAQWFKDDGKPICRDLIHGLYRREFKDKECPLKRSARRGRRCWTPTTSICRASRPTSRTPSRP